MTPEHRRLHPAAVVAEALGQLRQLALPLIVVIFAGGGGLTRLIAYTVIGGGIAIGAAWITWDRTRWWVDGGSIRLRTGLFTEHTTSVPYDRVQAIDTVRGPAQRLLGAVELHVQTAGGGAKGEIILRAVAPEVAEQLREHVRVRGALVAPERPEAVREWQLGRRRLLVAALTSGSLGVIVPVLAGASQMLDELGIHDAERLVPDNVHEALVAAAAVLGAAWVLSILGTLVAFAGFRVARDGERLRISRGIVERREASIPIARVGAIRIVESPLREPFGLAQVRIESAGYAKEPATAQALLPLVRRSQVETVLREVLPEFADGAASLEPPPGRALRRYVLPPFALTLPPAVATAVIFGLPGLAALALPALAALYGLAAYRAAGWRLEEGSRLVLRRRALQLTTLVADPRRLPEVFARTTVLQRRGDVSTVGVAVASGHRAAVRHLERATVTDLLARLTRAATG